MKCILINKLLLNMLFNYYNLIKPLKRSAEKFKQNAEFNKNKIHYKIQNKIPSDIAFHKTLKIKFLLNL